MVQTRDNVAQAIFRHRLWEVQISARKYEKNDELVIHVNKHVDVNRRESIAIVKYEMVH